MIGDFWKGDGQEWEDYIVELLAIKYGEKLQLIPATNKGDYGLDAFTMDGNAFQCYAAKEPLPNKTLYEKQRNKMTKDIKKFIDNKHELSKVFCNLKISNWFLVVPRWEFKELLEHAGLKTEEILNLNLPYVDNNFKVGVITDTSFPKEKDVFYLSNTDKIKVPFSNPNSSEITEWKKNQSDLVANCTRKLKNLNYNDEECEKKCEMFAKYFIKGQNSLNNLLNKYPSVYKTVMDIKNNKEDYLDAERMTATLMNKNGGEIITETRDTYKSEVLKIGLPADTAEILSYEAISDWIFRCPLEL